MHLADAPIIELDNVDSTNNYAMRLIDADKAQPGLTIVARRQEAGKGQRGKTWVDSHGESVLMSIIVKPGMEIREQFLFSISIALAVAYSLKYLHNDLDLKIKWPNDIIINDKKAGGILIENILRGNKWTHSIVGVGINVNQQQMPESLPNSISLCMAAGETFDIGKIREKLRLQILANTVIPPTAKALVKYYNDLLYRRGMSQQFRTDEGTFYATILSVAPDGALELQMADGSTHKYYHGQVMWEW
jgi:BirA family biotin operon repressor/biotin-[acetyl-CoA-carboxylase] ligase